MELFEKLRLTSYRYIAKSKTVREFVITFGKRGFNSQIRQTKNSQVQNYGTCKIDYWLSRPIILTLIQMQVILLSAVND